MSKKDAPTVLHIPAGWLKYPQSVEWLLVRKRLYHRTLLRKCSALFGFCNDEKSFVTHLLSRKQNYWVFRTNQQQFCGDFVIVDMSSPDPKKRKCFVLDLKQGAPLKIGGGGAGIQFKNVPLALDEIERTTGAIEAETPHQKLTGDRRLLLAFLGVELI